FTVIGPGERIVCKRARAESTAPALSCRARHRHAQFCLSELFTVTRMRGRIAESPKRVEASSSRRRTLAGESAPVTRELAKLVDGVFVEVDAIQHQANWKKASTEEQSFARDRWRRVDTRHGKFPR